MKKVFLSLFLAAISFSAVQAQQGLKFGGGINLAIPASKMDGISIGSGVDLMLHAGLSDNFAVTGDVGYTALFPKKDNGIKSSSIIPLRAGIRFYPSPNFFLGGKIGAGFMNTKFENTSLENYKATTTAYSFGAGYAMDQKLEIGASYDGYSKNGSSGLVNIRLGYWFGN